MKRAIALPVLGTALTTGTLRAQGTPQSITEKRVDMVKLATGYRAFQHTAPTGNRSIRYKIVIE
jgi:hypothetical protein